jgi:DNA-binding response OmpR family regulator
MRLLLIEDYKPLQKSLSQGLQEAGFAVDITGEGREGLWYASSNDYDVIILDIMLPGLDGLSILQKLRSAGKQTHVLLLTAKDSVNDRVKGLDLGADDYLVKPFAFEELLARIHALIRRKYHEKNPFVRIGDLRIDLAAKDVWSGKEKLSLTVREYALGVSGAANRASCLADRHMGTRV